MSQYRNSKVNKESSTELSKSSFNTLTSSSNKDQVASVSIVEELFCSNVASVTDDSSMIFQPRTTSTQIYSLEYNTPSQPIHGSDLRDNNESLIRIGSNDKTGSISTITSDINIDNKRKHNKDESSIKENDDRFNRCQFFFKGITTSMTHMEVFISIGTKYPLVQMNSGNNAPQIVYLCIADTSKTSNENLISIHLCFAKKVNFKHKFLNDLFPGLKRSDYLSSANADQFNAEIKLLSNGKYIESSVYTPKKGNENKKEKDVATGTYRQKQGAIVCSAFKQESLANAVAILKDNLPYEYLTFGNQMRTNIEYELQSTKRQKRIEYKPMYNSESFKIPEEHRDKIDEWMKNDFQMRIDGKNTGSRCLFIVGPTQHEFSLLATVILSLNKGRTEENRNVLVSISTLNENHMNKEYIDQDMGKACVVIMEKQYSGDFFQFLNIDVKRKKS